jgi:hypothetical protein
MATGKQIRAGGAFVEIGVNLTALEKGLRTVQAKMRAAGATIAKLGAGITAAFLPATVAVAKSVKTFANVGNELQTMSNRFGISAQSIGELGYVAEQEGASLQDLQGGIRRMARTITDAEDGLSTAVRVFDKLGLSWKSLKRMTPEQQFEAVAESLKNVKSDSTRASLAQQVFGRGGATLIPVLMRGAEGIAALRKEYRDLTGDFNAQSGKDVADGFTRIKYVLRGVQIQIGQALLPVVMELINRFTGIAIAARKFIEQNKSLVKNLAVLSGVLTGVGVAATGLGIALMALGSPLALIIGLIATIGVAAVSVAESFGLMDVGLNDSLGNMAKSLTLFGTGIDSWGKRIVLSFDTLFAGLFDSIAKMIAWMIERIADLEDRIGNAMKKFVAMNPALPGFAKRALMGIAGFQERGAKGERETAQNIRQNWGTTGASPQGKILEMFKAGAAGDRRSVSDAAKEIFNKLKDILSAKYTPATLPQWKGGTPDAENLIEKTAPKSQVTGLWGFQKASEFMGGAADISRQQLAVMRRQEALLQRVVEKIGDGGAEYA